jgi:hypothetical protein
VFELCNEFIAFTMRFDILFSVFVAMKPSLVVSIALSSAVPAHTDYPSATDLIQKGLAALGGEEALNKISGVSYHAPR